MLTRVFKSGNSLALRIPKELNFDMSVKDAKIERKGDALVIRAVTTHSPSGVMDAFATFPPGIMAEEPDWSKEE